MSKWRALLVGAISGLLVLAHLYAPRPEIREAEAQGVGIFQRASCDTITGAVTGQTWCFDQTARVLKVWNGTNWATTTLSNVGTSGFGGLFSVASCTAINSPIAGQSFCFDQTANTLKGWTGSFWISLPASTATIINVQDFGAKGDGVTDDRAALALALGVATTGQTIYFPPTTAYYRVVNPNTSGDTLSPNPNTHLWGYGARLQIEGSVSAGGEVLRINGNDNITIEGIEISISAALAATNGFSGIGCARRLSDNALFNRLRIINTYIHGFKTVAGNGGVGINCEVGGRGIAILGNLLDDNDNGIWLGTSTLYPVENVTVAGNVIRKTTFTSGTLNTSGNAIMVNHNTAIDPIRPDQTHVNATIVGNTIDGAPVAFHAQGVGHVNFTGNIASGVTTNVAFIEESRHVTVADNVATGTMTNFVRVLQISGAFGNQNQQIANNNFQGTASGAGLTADGSFTRSSFVGNKMGTTGGPRLSVTTPTANVLVDQDETATTGQVNFVNGLLLENNQPLNWRNGVGSAVPVFTLNGSNDLVVQRGGGATFMTLLNSTTTLQITGGTLQVVTGGGGVFGSPTGSDKGAGTLNIASASFAQGLPYMVASASGPSLASARGLSASQSLSNNLRGTCTFAAATTCVQGFTNNEPDAHYFVALSCSSTNPVGLSAKTRAGFTLTATASNSNTCDWILVR